MFEPKVLAALSLLALTALASPAQAQTFFDGTRPSGMGEAYTAIAAGPSAIFNNPAGVARSVTYAVEAGYEYNPGGNVLNAGIVDSKTNPSLAAGVGYSLLLGRDELDGVTGHDIRLALAVPVVPDRVSLGVGGRYILMNQTIDGTDEETTVEILNGLTLDAGAIFRITQQIHAGLSARNLIPLCEQIICQSTAPTIIEGGVGFEAGNALTVAADVGIDIERDSAVNVGVGAEYVVAGVVPVRLGYQRIGAEESNLLTAGLGYRSSAAGFDFGYQVDLSNTDYMLFIGSFSLYL
jgi:hypothetical protein